MSWLRWLGVGKSKSPDASALAKDWNALGRAAFAVASAGATAHYEGGQSVDEQRDLRPVEMAKAVLDEVIKLNQAGRWDSARRTFDPAHVPFIPMLDQQAQSISCITALGPDEYLFRLGSDYHQGDAIHIRDGRFTRLAGMLAMTASHNHDWLLIVDSDGFHIRSSLTAQDAAVLPWPVPVHRLDIVCISDDGRRIAFAHDEFGIWLGDTTLNRWQKFHPTDDYVAELKLEMEDEDYEWSASMVHCDLSPDGLYFAYGTQDYGHDVDRVGETLDAVRWCEVNPNIDYPHNACFSTDGRYLALNGCHFYNGETLVVDLPESEGLSKPDYEPDPRTPVIDPMLRVYASTWLPPEATGLDTGAFALAGSGILTAVTPGGRVLFSQYFGSSASSIDYCPQTRRLILGSFSGILHVYDIGRLAGAEETFGYRPRHELYRWTFWKDYPPFRW